MSNKSYLGIIIALLVIVLFWSVYNSMLDNQPEEKKQVSVIVSDSTNDRWNAMKEGMEQAALDNGIELNIVSTDVFNISQDVKNVIQREIQFGAGGIIFEPIDDGDMNEYLDSIRDRVEIILIKSDIAPGDVYSSVLPDEQEIIDGLTSTLEERYGAQLNHMKIVLIQTRNNQYSINRRRELFLKWFNTKGLVKITEADTAEALFEQSAEYPNILIALDNTATEGAIDALISAGKEDIIDIYGVGYSEKVVYYLDRQVVDAAIITDDFNMGYISVEQIAELLNFGRKTMHNKIGTMIISEENLYEPDYQRVLFPLVQ